MNITINKQMLLIGAAVALAWWLYERRNGHVEPQEQGLRNEIWGG